MAVPFRYSFQKSANEWYGFNNGVPGIVNTPYYFYEGIYNFAEVAFTITRNGTHGGLIRGRTGEVQFIEELATLMRWVYYTIGANAKCNMLLDTLNRFDFLYVNYGVTGINFSQARDERDQFTAFSADTGVKELIKTRINSEYDIPIHSHLNKKSVRLLPNRVKGRIRFLTMDAGLRDAEHYNWPAFSQLSETVVEITESPDFRPVKYYASEFTGTLAGHPETGQPANEIDNTWSLTTPTTTPGAGSAGNYLGFLFVSQVQLFDVRLKTTIPVLIDNNNGATDAIMEAYVLRATASATPNWSVLYKTAAVTVPPNTDTNHTFSIDTTFNLAANESVHVLFVLNHNSQVKYDWENGILCTVDFEHYTSEYVVTTMSSFDVAQALVNKMTNGTAVFKSDLLSTAISYAQGLDCQPDKLMVCSTQSIQGRAEAKMTITFEKLMKTLLTTLSADFGVEYDPVLNREVVRIEKMSYFFDKTKVIKQFSRVKQNSLNIKAAEDRHFSELHIGYTPEDTDDINGKDEFNTTLKFTSTFTKVEKVLDMISPISASGYAIYREYISGATGDTSSTARNNIFLLQRSGSFIDGVYNAFYPVHANPNYSVSGITDTDRPVNSGLTPQRCLRRNDYWIISHMSHGQPGDVDNYLLTIQSQEKNPKYISRLTGSQLITEFSNVRVNELLAISGRERLFYPIILEAAILPQDVGTDFKTQWEQTQYGRFDTVFYSKATGGFATVSIYPIEFDEVNEAQPDTSQLKGYLLGDTDLSTLIR